MMFNFIFFVYFVDILLINEKNFIITHQEAKKKSINPLNELFNNILFKNDYSTLARPIVNSTNKITRVETELKLLQIDLDEKYQELISTAWIEMTWFDNRLEWNPDEYDGITEITVDVDRIWVNINIYLLYEFGSELICLWSLKLVIFIIMFFSYCQKFFTLG
jgi:hypothetical protein